RSTASRYSCLNVRDESGGTCPVNSPMPTRSAMAGSVRATLAAGRVMWDGDRVTGTGRDRPRAREAPMDKTELWNDLAAQLCVDSIRASTAAGSGHPTSSMSAAHLLAVLYADHLRYDVDDPENQGNDRFILSKGHA